MTTTRNDRQVWFLIRNSANAKHYLTIHSEHQLLQLCFTFTVEITFAYQAVNEVREDRRNRVLRHQQCQWG